MRTIIKMDEITKTKKTKQREAILEILKNTKSHPTADEIYQKVRQEIPRISKGTVYRNLKLLAEKGEAIKIDTEGTEARYDARVESHYHFRCDSCGKVFDVDVPVDAELDKKAAQETGFNITHHILEFRGLCSECQKKTIISSRGDKNKKEV
ncbi:MAG: Fur family transcriptional regulator, peroxide stress response regulator [Candidatus Atribacteria bacterium]|jgi:Fur family peroxide stress response transcriptional regulator|nr:Fur family transcriptional regulator, peroxide stress response regulator [Candidatus Atribacteria bacterium]